MENTDSSSNHNDHLQSTNDGHQLNGAASEPSSSATQASAASSTSNTSSTDASASTSAGASFAEPATDAAQASSIAQQTPSTPSHTQAAPAATLWENFMASFRNVIQRDPAPSAQNAQSSSSMSSTEPTSQSGTHASPPTANTQPEVSPVATTADQDSTDSARLQDTAGPSAESAPDASGMPRSPVFFRLPFSGPDGSPALLAFHPQPLPQQGSQSDSQSPSAAPPTSPHNASAQPSLQSQQGASQANTYSTGRPGAVPDAAQDHARPHSHPHPDGHVPISPIFVPFGASPLPFSFLYDQHTSLAWPIAQVTPGSPPGGPSPDAPESQQPRLVAGPPFRIILDIHFAAPPEPEQPDPEKAAKYVQQLERADAELRARMARLGMGSIGGFADAAGGDDQDALLGCGVCLDNYEAEDRPEWIDGQKSQDEAVVAVPCPGHHTLHAGCFREWLAKLPPSQWTCPFCRASLSPDTTHRPAQNSAPSARGTTGSSRTSLKAASTSSAPVHTTLREDVRARERQRGWRCDAPACFPRYPVSSRTDDGHFELPETSDGMTTDLVKLTPCRHEVHLDCLCTSMRVENDLVCADDLDAIMGYSEDGSDDELRQKDGGNAESTNENEEERDIVGKWVTCPTCRKECWAELPLRRKPHRSAADASAQQTRQATPEEGASTLAVKNKSPSCLKEREADAGSKAPQLAPPQIDRDQTTREGTSDVAVASGDHEEEAVVNAMLLSS
ncbi:hypothetical protein NDA16_004876 [Ustilago loliicola]|nr:hypothetical protein NDA16_004876 [Ustilago loliicola]